MPLDPEAKYVIEGAGQPGPDRFEGRVPLAVPVGVGHDGDRPGHEVSGYAPGWCDVLPSQPTRVQHRYTSSSLPASAGGRRARLDEVRSGQERRDCLWQQEP